MASNNDIFGYSKTTTSGGVLSFSDVIIKVGSNDLMLCQRVDVNYERTITPVMGVGYADIWLAPMPATGRATVSRAIVLTTAQGASGQSAGLLVPYKQNSSCEMQDLTISPAGSNNCAPKSGTVKGRGMLQSVTIQITTGQGVSVTDGATWTLADLKVGE